MLSLLAQSGPENWVSFALGAGALMGGIGYAAGQFLSARRRALGDSLETALNELSAMKTRADRLEGEVGELRGKVQRLGEENNVLRSAIASGDHIAPAIENALRVVTAEVRAIAEEQHQETRALLHKLGDGEATT